jgi:hypothetical protein
MLWRSLKKLPYFFMGGPKHGPSPEINIFGAVHVANNSKKYVKFIGMSHFMNYP